MPRIVLSNFSPLLAGLLLAAALFLFPLQSFAGLEEGKEAIRRSDVPTALEHLVPLAEAGNTEAQYWLGSIYNIPGAPVAYQKEAAKWFKMAAEGRHPASMHIYGEMLYEGRGVKMDRDAAFAFFANAAHAGIKESTYWVGKIYEYGTPKIQPDINEAIKWYRAGMALKDSNAILKMGGLYFEGEGVRRDIEKAIKYMKASAQMGNSYALFNLGIIYDFGRGVKEDDEKAKDYYIKAMQFGNKQAEGNLRHLTQQEK